MSQKTLNSIEMCILFTIKMCTPELLKNCRILCIRVSEALNYFEQVIGKYFYLLAIISKFFLFHYNSKQTKKYADTQNF